MRNSIYRRKAATRHLALVTWSGIALLSGCATQSSALLGSPLAQRFSRLEVLELPPGVDDRALRRVLHSKHDELDAAMLAADRQRINQSLEKTLQETSPCVSSTAAPIAVVSLDDLGASVIGRPLDLGVLSSLQAAHPADAYLRLRVTDYGETPRRWKSTYIAFEVVSTLAVAGALYLHKVTRPVAGAYLLEESIEEFSEGYAGFWTLNRLSRPVRLEGDLIDGKTGRPLRHETHTGLAAWHWRSLRGANALARDDLLAASMRKAVAAVVGTCPSP